MKPIKRIALTVVAALALGLFSFLPSVAQLDEADALNRKVIELVQAKKFAEAAPMAQRVLAMRESKLGRDHADVVAARKTLAQIYRALGRNAEAEAIEKRAQQTFELSSAPTAQTASKGPVPPPQTAPRVQQPASPAIAASPPSAPSRDVPMTTRSMRPPAPSASPSGNSSSDTSAAGPALPDFPWPPPTASALYNLPRNLLQNRATIGQAADTIVAALERTGYVERSFFRTQADGVALVTRLESINDDGTALAEGKRWPTLQNSKDLMSAVKGLFYVDRGLYRVIVFVLQDRPFVQSPNGVSGQQALSWLRTGANMLPREIADRPFDKGEVSVLIYEFASDGTAVRRIDSSLTGKQHLEKAGVMSYLERTN
jgi:hypothetical protein